MQEEGEELELKKEKEQSRSCVQEGKPEREEVLRGRASIEGCWWLEGREEEREKKEPREEAELISNESSFSRRPSEFSR